MTTVQAFLYGIAQRTKTLKFKNETVRLNGDFRMVELMTIVCAMRDINEKVITKKSLNALISKKDEKQEPPHSENGELNEYT